VNFSFSDRAGVKPRPALVVQDDAWNGRISNTIVASISSTYRGTATQLLIDVSTPEGASAGLKLNSAVLCENLLTIDQTKIRRTIGHLPPTTMLKINACLKAALGLP
jgi:mRNA interferase MazF